MKAFVAVLSVLALASADQVHHQAVKLGNAPTVTTTIAKAHGAHAAAVHSQPSAQPSEVNQYHNEEKYEAGNIAPVSPYANKPVHHAPIHHAPVHVAHAPVHVPVHHAPVVHAAPAYHAPAPAYKPAPAPAYKPAPAPYHAPAPAYKPAHKPAPYHEPAYEEPAVYKYGYAVADDYSGANFESNESRDGYATSGSYRVALPDGRIQTVTYRVDDAHSGVVMDVQYEGTPQYPEYHPPAHKAVHAPLVHAAPVVHPVHAY